MKGKLDLSKLASDDVVYLVGIGGAGMSAIATVLLQMGKRVMGSDIKESPNVRRLRRLGAEVGIGHRAQNVGNATIIIRSSAISERNPELSEARRRAIPVFTRAQMLAAIMATRRGIAVAGTHGKTTTSSLVAQMLLAAETDPSFLIGGELNETGGNAHYGEGEFLVAEADESDGSLLCLYPEAAVLTNVDGDHLDYFKSKQEVASLFMAFLKQLNEGGFAVICGDDPSARSVGEEYAASGGKVRFYGAGPENYYRFEGPVIGEGGGSFTALRRGEEIGNVEITIPGKHNMYNTLAAMAVGLELGISGEKVIKGVGEFKGVRRRFETVGECSGVKVIDDYAHHPTEIKAVLELAHSIARTRVVVVFQPHRYSRTELLAHDFGRSFDDADVIVVTDVYGAGEDPIPGITGRLIADNILEHSPGKAIIYEPKRADLAREAVKALKEGDMVITMGAGDVTQCAREILELLAR